MSQKKADIIICTLFRYSFENKAQFCKYLRLRELTKTIKPETAEYRFLEKIYTIGEDALTDKDVKDVLLITKAILGGKDVKNFDAKKWVEVKSDPEKRFWFISRLMSRLEDSIRINGTNSRVQVYFDSIFQRYKSAQPGRYQLPIQFFFDRIDESFCEIESEIEWYFSFAHNRERIKMDGGSLESQIEDMVFEARVTGFEFISKVSEMGIYDTFPEPFSKQFKKLAAKYDAIMRCAADIWIDFEPPKELPDIRNELGAILGFNISESQFIDIIFSINMAQMEIRSFQGEHAIYDNVGKISHLLDTGKQAVWDRYMRNISRHSRKFKSKKVQATSN